MKKAKVLTFASALALSFCGSYALADYGASQLGSVDPAPGTISSDYEKGIAGITFPLSGKGSTVNRDADAYATLKRNGEVIANVPASNTAQITYDSFYAYVWTISFFDGANKITTLPGEYEVYIEPGFFLLGVDKTPSTEISLSYTIKGTGSTSVLTSPESRSNVTSIQDVVLTFPDAVSVKYDSSKSIEIFNFNGKYDSGDVGDDDDITPLEGLHPEVQIKGNEVTLHLSSPQSEPGTWMVEVPAAAFTLVMSDDTEVASDAINLDLIIADYRSGVPTVNPSGTVALLPGTIILTTADGKEVGTVNNMGVNYVYPINEDGTRGNYIARYRAEKDPTNSRQILLKNWLGADQDIYPAPGKYVLVTCDRLFKAVGESTYLSPVEFEYEVVPFDFVPTELIPADGALVKEIKELSFVFGDNDVVTTQWTSKPGMLKSSTTNYTFNPIAVAEGSKTVTFTTPVGATKPGVYNFVSAPGSLYVDGQSVSVTGTYTITDNTGVECIENVYVMPEIFDIYSLDGVLVAKDANAQQLFELPAGIYVAAGKKFVIK